MKESGASPHLWPAKRHTLAKIAILKGFLYAWFSIFGREAGRGNDVFYIDGFAGPGRYSNSHEGSPIAALTAARAAISLLGASWSAGRVHCIFIEKSPRNAGLLTDYLAPFRNDPRIVFQIVTAPFEQGIRKLNAEIPRAFTGTHPLFSFVDPFGSTDVPFETIADLLRSRRSEVLINFDADGLVRIFQAGIAADAERILTTTTGDESWKGVLKPTRRFRENVVALVQHYRARLFSLPNVRYAYPFEMLTSARIEGTVGYFLIFASQHPTGLEKMKGAMKAIDNADDYRFSNARVHQQELFRVDRTDEHADAMLARYVEAGSIPYNTLRDFALNETPYLNPKPMLRSLERRSRIEVEPRDLKRRRGTFKDEEVIRIKFLKGVDDGAEKRD